MVDHGKRSGIEHFVKIISWAGQDENGNKVIKNFCLDVDKSNHSAKDCAEAISMSIKRLRATAGFVVVCNCTKNNLPANREGYEGSETTVGKLSKRRICIYLQFLAN